MHITHIMYIFRIDEMKEMNPYIGEEVSDIYKYNVQVKSGKFYSSFVIGYSHNVVCIHYLVGGR